MKKILLILLVLTTGCNKAVNYAQSNIDRKLLQSTIGKEYESFASENKLTVSGAVFGQDKVYGNFISSSHLPDGGKIMKHIDKYKSGGSQLSMGLPVGIGSQSMAYRIFYFNVGPNGIVRDWASAFYNKETKDCISAINIGIDLCGNAENVFDYNQLDTLVKTSQGHAIDVWYKTSQDS